MLLQTTAGWNFHGNWSSRRLQLQGPFLLTCIGWCSCQNSQWPSCYFLRQHVDEVLNRLLAQSCVTNLVHMTNNCDVFWACHIYHNVLNFIHLFITSILKSLVILAMWLVLRGAIYSQIGLSFALNRIFFLGQWEWHRKTKQPIRFQGFF